MLKLQTIQKIWPVLFFDRKGSCSFEKIKIFILDQGELRKPGLK